MYLRASISIVAKRSNKLKKANYKISKRVTKTKTFKTEFRLCMVLANS